MAEEGINGAIAGRKTQIYKFLQFLKTDSRFFDIEYKELANKNGCKNYIRVQALGIDENFIKSMNNLILNIEEYKFKNGLYSAKNKCPSNFIKCPCQR